MAEIESGILSRQCLDRRIPTPNLLQTEAVPFIIIMLVWLVVVTTVPQLSLYLVGVK